MAKTAIKKDKKERELYRATKKFLPGVPVFVLLVSADFGTFP